MSSRVCAQKWTAEGGRNNYFHAPRRHQNCLTCLRFPTIGCFYGWMFVSAFKLRCVKWCLKWCHQNEHLFDVMRVDARLSALGVCKKKKKQHQRFMDIPWCNFCSILCFAKKTKQKKNCRCAQRHPREKCFWRFQQVASGTPLFPFSTLI